MTRRRCSLLTILVLGAYAGCSPSPDDGDELRTEPGLGRISADGSITADTFDVRYELHGDSLTVAIETDLPDVTHLVFSVNRSYWKQGDPEEYVNQYVSDGLATVGAYRSPKTFVLDQARWDSILEEKRRLLGVREPFRISPTLDIRFTVPINQDPPFAEFNANLSGKVVEHNGNRRLVRWEKRIQRPVGGAQQPR